jgi:uncharacterized protein YeaO (DUF488 family)
VGKVPLRLKPRRNSSRPTGVHGLRVRRVYDARPASDGVRVLVDRLWPRRLSRERARIDHWMKDVAPSGQLRRWYGHDAKRRDEFKRRYFDELRILDEPVTVLCELMKSKTVTLLYSARPQAHNNAVALAESLHGK